MMLARTQAIKRLKQNMKRPKKTRVSTKKYYRIRINQLERSEEAPLSMDGQESSHAKPPRPREVLMSKFIINKAAPVAMAMLETNEEA